MSTERTPWSLLVAAGAAPAWFVVDASSASPGGGYVPSAVWLLALIAGVAVFTVLHRQTGIPLRRTTRAGWAAAAGALVLTLAMFSAALALVSTGHAAWVAAPAVLTWVGAACCATV